MTTQDALNDLKRAIYELTNPLYLERFKDQFSTLQALIDKQIPKTVYLVGEHKLYNCPTCDKGVKSMESYCWHCGQTLFFEKTYSQAEVENLWNAEESYDKATGRSCARYDLAEEDDD